MKRILLNAVLPLQGALVLLTAKAQSGGSDSISWSTFDGGGGTSSGGTYSMSGTIGQPDAGRVSGGGFVLSGGFWAGIAEAITGPVPALSIRLAGGNDVILAWPNPSTGYVLQQTANMNGSGGGWADVPQTPVVIGPNKEVTLTATGSFCMFRLHRP